MKKKLFILPLAILLFLALGTFNSPKAFAWVCGNGIVEDQEQCDDGNTNDKDGCSSKCQNEVIVEKIVEKPVEVEKKVTKWKTKTKTKTKEILVPVFITKTLPKTGSEGLIISGLMAIGVTIGIGKIIKN